MLSDLESNAWLSDKRFAEQYIFSKKIKYGIKKIAYELKIRGVNELIISEAIGSIRAEEFSLAQAIWKGPPQDNQEKIKQIRFLQGRGIDSSVIQKILSGKSFEYYENVN
jgi:regulatory protein